MSRRRLPKTATNNLSGRTSIPTPSDQRSCCPSETSPSSAISWLVARMLTKAFPMLCLHLTGSTAGACPVGIGFATSASGNGFALKTGGGVDWNHGRWGIRILEVDYVHTSTRVSETEDDCRTCGVNQMQHPRQRLGIVGGRADQPRRQEDPAAASESPPVANCSLDKSSVFAASNDTVAITATASDHDDVRSPTPGRQPAEA